MAKKKVSAGEIYFDSIEGWEDFCDRINSEIESLQEDEIEIDGIHISIENKIPVLAQLQYHHAEHDVKDIVLYDTN